MALIQYYLVEGNKFDSRIEQFSSQNQLSVESLQTQYCFSETM